MKKLKLFGACAVFLLSGTCVFGQAFDEGKSVVTIGYGVPNMVKTIMRTTVRNAYQTGAIAEEIDVNVKGMGPVLGKYEYGVSKIVGICGVVAYSSASINASRTYTETNYNNNTNQYVTGIYTDKGSISYSSFSVGGRLNFHFGVQDKLDPYAGIAAGFSAHTLSATYSSNNPNYIANDKVTTTLPPIYFGLTIGLRGYFTENIGAYGEFGFDKLSLFQAGLAVKF